MVGSALVRKLKQKGVLNLLTRTSQVLDLTIQQDVLDFFESEKPDIVFIAAAKVGGIHANNTYRGQFIYENLMIQSNIIHASHLHKIKKLLFLGSSCIYPKLAPQPMEENILLTGKLEPTNEPYAIAKIAGIKMCENYFKQYGDEFISVMPTNLYGPNDNYDLLMAHVLPALVRKFFEAKLNNKDFVEIWGSGMPKREFLHVDDMANACIFIMESLDAKTLYNDMSLTHLNIGTGIEISIKELAQIISDKTGFAGRLKFDSTKPDGTHRKLLDIFKLISLGWTPKISIIEGIEMAIDDYKNNYLRKE